MPCRRELLRAPEPQTLTATDPHSRSSSKLHGNQNRFAGRSHPSANSPCPLHRHTETTRAHTNKLTVPVCGVRGSHKLYGSPTPLCPTHSGCGLGLGRAEVGRGSDAGEVYPQVRGCRAAPGHPLPVRMDQVLSPKRRDTGASELRNSCPPRLGERRQTGSLALPRLLRQGSGSAAYRPSPEQNHYTRGSAQVPSERKTEVGFCLTWSHGAIS